jgi:hypothetical protein
MYFLSEVCVCVCRRDTCRERHGPTCGDSHTDLSFTLQHTNVGLTKRSTVEQILSVDLARQSNQLPTDDFTGGCFYHG